MAVDTQASQSVKALLSLRELILSGELEPGERISELTTVERLGVSRTPLRAALVRLAEEGLLEAIPSGGFAVKAFSERDIFDSIEIRGTLEGLAARMATERGPSPSELMSLRGCLAELDAVVAQPMTLEDFSRYDDLNGRFHRLLVELANSPTLERQIAKASALPFASPSGFVMAQSVMPEAFKTLTIAQDQHRCIVDAIENRESTRAENLVREHARVARRNVQLALNNKETLDLVPGAPLIRRRA